MLDPLLGSARETYAQGRIHSITDIRKILHVGWWRARRMWRVIMHEHPLPVGFKNKEKNGQS